MEIEPRARQRDENDRLMRELIELRGRQIASTTDSAQGYDELHAEGELRQRDSFYKWLLSLLDPQGGEVFLDVSCGQGALMHFALQTGLRVVGFDLSSSAVTMAAQRVGMWRWGGRLPSALVSLADAQQLPFPDNSFDFITNIGSLEHYMRPDLAVRETARVLHPGGTALILLPNTFGLLGNVIHVWRTGDVHDDGQPLQRYGTNVQWQKLLELNGLQIAKTIRYEREWPRTWEDLWWYVLRPHKLGRVLLAPLIPTNLSSFLIYRCRKASS